MSLGRVFLALLAVLGFAVAAGTILVAVKPELFFEMEGKALALSLADELGEARDHETGGRTCRRRGDDVWRCEVEHDPGSGDGATYYVRALDDECWRLEPRSAREHFDRPYPEVRGCLGFLDYVGFG